MPSPYPIYSCGDQALTVVLGDAIDTGINDKVVALSAYLRSLRMEGIRDIIPSYHTVTVVYDAGCFPAQLREGSLAVFIRQWLEQALQSFPETLATHRQLRIPVCYDPTVAWDIVEVAELAGISVDEVIEHHIARRYRVYLVGFLPGFAYMGKLDPRIATPRKATPRTKVPMGSVGIAGEQTGIYPFDSPGGWQIIGQTPVTLFNSHDAQPCYLQAGDEVEFYPIDITTFKQAATHERHDYQGRTA